MNDATSGDDRELQDDENVDDTHGDELDDAVIAADDTGMLAGERLITTTELAQGDPDLAPEGDV